MNHSEHNDLLVRIDENVKALLQTQGKHEERIRSLERFRNWAAGVGATIGAFLGIHASN